MTDFTGFIGFFALVFECGGYVNAELGGDVLFFGDGVAAAGAGDG